MTSLENMRRQIRILALRIQASWWRAVAPLATDPRLHWKMMNRAWRLDERAEEELRGCKT